MGLGPTDRDGSIFLKFNMRRGRPGSVNSGAGRVQILKETGPRPELVSTPNDLRRHHQELHHHLLPLRPPLLSGALYPSPEDLDLHRRLFKREPDVAPPADRIPYQ
ncbi:hypothetical protein C1H46_031394 [Malus baccata]|uniref:Uncharacterized protein n=1 Tax=Malus baccata TaxID=106549 RepID=A0A540L958_MALBA|nr:hypothetical protein C1H46_031394 [Malus baccata]